MFDDEKIVEETQPEQTQPEQQPEQQEVPAQESPVQAPVETPADRNLRAMAKKMREVERERDEALRLAQEKHAPVEEPDEEINIGNDDIAEGKHVKAITQKIKRMEEKLRKYEQASTTMSAEAMLKAQYPDIDKVVTKENLDALRESDPEFAEMLDTSSSFRAKAISAYKHIKKLGLYVEDNYVADRELAQKNASKPKPLASVSPQQGDSPLSRANAFANGLTPELQKQLLQEMAEARKNR
jgi:hypothetical protein